MRGKGKVMETRMSVCVDLYENINPFFSRLTKLFMKILKTE